MNTKWRRCITKQLVILCKLDQPEDFFWMLFWKCWTCIGSTRLFYEMSPLHHQGFVNVINVVIKTISHFTLNSSASHMWSKWLARENLSVKVIHYKWLVCMLMLALFPCKADCSCSKNSCHFPVEDQRFIHNMYLQTSNCKPLLTTIAWLQAELILLPEMITSFDHKIAVILRLDTVEYKTYEKTQRWK